jgi:hypothetical protein
MLGFQIDPAQEAALIRGMAVLQEHRFQSVSELYASLYGSQTGTPQQYQQLQQQHQQPPQQMHPSQQQYQPPPLPLQDQHYQTQSHYGNQQPPPFTQTPTEKPGWLKRFKVPVGIGGAALILIILLGIIFSSDSPSGTPVVPPNNDVTVSPSLPPTAAPEPTPAQINISGTWVMRNQDGYTAEFAFADNNRFYLVLFETSDYDPDSFIVLEGTFSINGENLVITPSWGAEHDEGIFVAAEIYNERWNFTFNLNGQTLTIYDEDGLPEVYTGGQTLGLWSFNHRETTVFSEYVEDMPYTVTNALASVSGYYTGLWSNDMPNGFGEFTNGESGEIDDQTHFIEGAFLRGTWVNGLVEGFGESGCPTSGASYLGDHVNGLRSGFGIYTWGNGDVYVGYWEGGYMNGEGTINHHEEGYSMEAFWVNSEPVGNVVITLDDGTVYDGVIEDGELVSLTAR